MISDLPNLKARIDYLEENRRFVQNAMEMALSLGDFQEQLNQDFTPERILEETERRIRQLIHFEVRALYALDSRSSDMELTLCDPAGFQPRVEQEMRFLIDEGFVAWAIRERRGVCILSKDQSRYILLHIIATHSRIRGLFVGFFPSGEISVPDVSLDLLSVILRNAANAAESAAYRNLVRNQKHLLQSALKRQKKELVHYERRLRRAQKMEAIGTLAGGVAHDLNNILTGIVSYPDLILMKTPADSPLVKPLNTIKETGKKAAAIVQDLLTLARRGVTVSEVINLNDRISEYLDSPEFEMLKMHHPSVKFKTNLSADLLNIIGSPAHISKTVMNMVANGAEAMPDGGVLTLSTANRYIDVPVRGYDDIIEGDYVVLTISDTGIGISSENMERIFEPFYTKKVMGRSGTGLGMAVVWGTVKDHNGYIDLKSTEGKGTVCHLYFPVLDRKIPIETAGPTYKNYQGSGEHILVVDDIEEQREIARLILTELGYTVLTAAGGEAAVARSGEHGPFDLLVLDMIMEPGMDGLDTYREILAHCPGQRAIIASGFSETDRVREAMKLGAGQYVKKPYTVDRLGKAVRAELDR